ncbi:hypothetical protein [Persicobacter diffluens]|uniref:Uncharacterized protein n=1 Tax=Persicobacter diffluens TaxID=981 RepID=A0AAN4W135_9BACT|nr:hypothetical protein PEDI_33430 [Persicobacter diffluens]
MALKHFTPIFHVPLLLLLLAFFGTQSVQAQVYSNREVNPNREVVSDSLKQIKYPYVLPILGEKAAQAGYTLPLSAGMSLNYLFQESDVTINNLMIGFNNGPMYNLDDVIRFKNAQARTSAFNFRPDIWILPFLNVYGIIAGSASSTEVDFGVFVPNGTGYTEIIDLQTKADFSGLTAGFGITPTIGIANGWLALDMNFTWTDIDALEEPAFSFVFGPRMGKTFKFSKKSNLAVWVGGFRVKINSGTSGTLPLDALLSGEGALEKIDQGYMRLEEAQNQLDSWWEGLTSAQQRIYQPVYDRSNEAIGRVGEALNALENGLNQIGESTVQYSLDKQQKEMWNFLVGAQYQLNPKWMFRGEVGFLGTRTQVLAGIQYRFGL